MKKLGDMLSTIATPIAWSLGLPCVDPATGQLRPESGCNKRRQQFNDFSDAFIDAFMSTSKQKQGTAKMETKETKMVFIITKQILVEADSPEEAVANIANGKTVSFSVNPRAQMMPKATATVAAPSTPPAK